MRSKYSLSLSNYSYSHLKFQPDFYLKNFELLSWHEIEKKLEDCKKPKKESKIPTEKIVGPMSNLSKSLTLKHYKKGLFRNLKMEGGVKDKKVKIEELPFWCDVYNKDFSLKLDEIYGQSEFSKAEIVQKYQLFRWASQESKLFTNKYNLDLNFGEILYCYPIHFPKIIPIYESLPNSDCHIYDQVDQVKETQPEPVPRKVIGNTEKTLPESEVKSYEKFE